MARRKDCETLNVLLLTMEMKRGAHHEAQAAAFDEWLRQARAFCDAHLVTMQVCHADGELYFYYYMGYNQCSIAENGIGIGKLKKPDGLNLCENGPGAQRLKRAYYSLCVDPWTVETYHPPGFFQSFNFETRTADPRLPKRIADMWLRYS